jgi:pimeloyl-ACP methyl ester carboxylesterase
VNHWVLFFAALAALAALLLVHAAVWARVYRVAPRQDELRFADTRDGWRLALARRVPRGEARWPPVLLCHGLSANRASLDFGVERWSLSRALADAGFDCFALDLRGHGASRRARRGAPRGWTFDTYLAEDIPAALDAVREATRSAQVLWVGHSQGALLGLVAAGLFPDRIAGVVAIAPPTHLHVPELLRRYVRFAFLATGRGQRFLARAASPLGGRLHPALAQVAMNSHNVDPRLYRQVMANVVEDVSPGVLRQFLEWARRDRLTSLDGKLDYREGLSRARQPALFVSGAGDLLVPPASVQQGFAAWGGDKEYWNAGREAGLSADYGHSDLIFGLHAPEEIYPRVVQWLRAHSEAARPTDVRPAG